MHFKSLNHIKSVISALLISA